MDNYEKIMEALKQIEISQAVLIEKLTQMDQRLDRTNKRLDHANKDFDEIKSRVERLEKIAGGIVFAVGILGALIKFKII